MMTQVHRVHFHGARRRHVERSDGICRLGASCRWCIEQYLSIKRDPLYKDHLVLFQMGERR